MFKHGDEEKWKSGSMSMSCKRKSAKSLIFNGIHEKITLEKRNEEAYNSLMRNWFGEPYPPFEEGYTRFEFNQAATHFQGSQTEEWTGIRSPVGIPST